MTHALEVTAYIIALAHYRWRVHQDHVKLWRKVRAVL